MVVDKGIVLGCSGPLGSFAHGCCACFAYAFLGESRIQNPFAEEVESLKLKESCVTATYPVLDACYMCGQ